MMTPVPYSPEGALQTGVLCVHWSLMLRPFQAEREGVPGQGMELVATLITESLPQYRALWPYTERHASVPAK